ncbi:MAG: YfhO family protein [Bdellovibrionales bacterium]
MSADTRRFHYGILTVISSLAFLLLFGRFVVGENYFSSDFYHIHFLFEHAFQSFDRDGIIPLWLPLFQGGKALFGDMALSYWPYSLDFFITYYLAKFVGLFLPIDLVVVHTLRLLGLAFLFAFGVKRLAFEVTHNRFASEIAFLMGLFANAFFLPHRPAAVTCNILTPWILWAGYKFIMNRDGANQNFLIFSLLSSTMMLQFFNVHTTIVLPLIAFFFVMIWLLHPGIIRRPKWTTLFISATGLMAAVAPHAWSFSYFKAHNVKMPWPGEDLSVIQTNSIYRFEHFLSERFEWQKLMSAFFPEPFVLQATTNLVDGIPGFFVHNFAYFSMVGAMLFLLSLFRVQLKVAVGIVLALISYFLFSTVNQISFFEVLFRSHAPMSRHLLFVFLHSSPLVVLMIGLALSAANIGTRLSRRTFGLLVAGVLLLIAVALGFLDYQFWNQPAQSPFLLATSALLVLITGAIVLWSQDGLKSWFTQIALYLVVLVDLFLFNRMALEFIVRSGRDSTSHIYLQAINYHSRVRESDLLDQFATYSIFDPTEYAVWESPTYLFPELYKYPAIGIQSFYQALGKTDGQTYSEDAAYFRPRLRFENRSDGFLKLKDEAISISNLGLPVVTLGTKGSKNSSPTSWPLNSVTMNEGDELTLIFDLGERGARAFNFVQADLDQPFQGNNSLIGWAEGSQDLQTWAKLVYLTNMDFGKYQAKSWFGTNQTSFRFYRLRFENRGSNFVWKDFPELRFGLRQRVLSTPSVPTEKINLKPADFTVTTSANTGLSLISYPFPQRLEITTYDLNPLAAPLFAHAIFENGSEPLFPTWLNRWDRPYQIQINFQKSNQITIALPPERLKLLKEVNLELAPPSADIQISDFNAHMVRAQVLAKSLETVVFSNTFEENWQAKIDGQNVPISLFRDQFMSVRVPEGKHELEFQFRPKTYWLLVWLAYGGLLAQLLGLAYYARCSSDPV